MRFENRMSKQETQEPLNAGLSLSALDYLAKLSPAQIKQLEEIASGKVKMRTVAIDAKEEAQKADFKASVLASGNFTELGGAKLNPTKKGGKSVAFSLNRETLQRLLTLNPNEKWFNFYLNPIESRQVKLDSLGYRERVKLAQANTEAQRIQTETAQVQARDEFVKAQQSEIAYAESKIAQVHQAQAEQAMGAIESVEEYGGERM